MLEQNLLPNSITDYAELGILIPQKPPMVMVGELLHFSKEKVVSGFTVTATNIFTANGQFTEPGLIENMAQTVALHAGYDFFIKNKPAPLGYIGAIKKTFIKTLPNIGDKIITTAYILHEFMGITLVKIKVELAGKEIANSEMKTVIVKK